MSQAADLRNIDVRKFFSRQRIYRADLALSLFPRLREVLADRPESEAGKIQVDLQFQQSPEGDCFITGTIDAELALSCQRCLQSLDYPLHSEIRVQVLETIREGGDRELDADELEVVLSEQGKLDLLGLIEDEAILSLPIVVYHDSLDCNQDLSAFRQEQGELQAQSDTKPFAELEGLKQQLQAEKQKLKQLQDKDTKSD